MDALSRIYKTLDMEMEEQINHRLRLRGFTEKTILNNRGLIGATIDETILIVIKGNNNNYE